jgi:signal peptidase I
MGTKRTVVAAVLVVAAVITVRTQFLDTMTVSSASMAPTLCTGDTVMVTRTGGEKVGVGDVITFPGPEDHARTIKRVVATAGQRVALEDGELVVDGAMVHEPYVNQASIDGVYFGPVTVPPGHVFVMGDNREISIDSRRYGPISTADITGRLLTDLSLSCHS